MTTKWPSAKWSEKSPPTWERWPLPSRPKRPWAACSRWHFACPNVVPFCLLCGANYDARPIRPNHHRVLIQHGEHSHQHSVPAHLISDVHESREISTPLSIDRSADPRDSRDLDVGSARRHDAQPLRWRGKTRSRPSDVILAIVSASPRAPPPPSSWTKTWTCARSCPCTPSRTRPPARTGNFFPTGHFPRSTDTNGVA